MSCADFLFELGTEELPAGQLTTMAEALCDTLSQSVTDKGLQFESSRWFATPRRLSVYIKGLTLAAPAVEREVLGPPVASAKDSEGNWTPAAQGFARKQGVAADALIPIDTDKGLRLGLRVTEAGAVANDVLPELVSLAVAAIPVSKRMRWGRSRDEFLRPVQWLVLLLGDEVLPLSLYSCKADRITWGHRFHHPAAVSLVDASSYESSMLKAKVIADFEVRKARIKKQVEALAEGVDARAVIDPALLNEVTGLVEWPVALMGSFDRKFLDVPAEALISSMKAHQKYFHLVDHDSQLLPRFITVANIESSDPSQVISGNERVIRPRLSDAAFFFETDKQTSLSSRLQRLDGVVFQQKLGTLADKTKRIVGLTQAISDAFRADSDISVRAAKLCKCDLVSDMVLEFPELQGIAGGHYARHDGEDAAVADAVEQHYWPRFAGDQLPATAEARAVALADRLDTMVGIFGIGQLPTGSKDPFGLRRAALAVIRILIAQKNPIALTELVAGACAQYPAGLLSDTVNSDVVGYIIERLRAFYEDQGIAVEVLRAVTRIGITAPTEIDARVNALHAFADTEAAVALAAANKRVANILAKAEQTIDGQPTADLLQEAAEKSLFDALSQAKSTLDPLLECDDYPAALTVLADLRAPIDAFFDGVMVNAEDPALKLNRLNLLSALRAQFLRVADIAEMATR
jgi:glycyl-tRNA synthetase beta chain